MPLFDLRCNDCNEEFSKIVSFNELPQLECPSCQSKNHERIYKANVKGPVHSNTGSNQAPPLSGFT